MTGGIGFTKLSQVLQRNNRLFLKHSDKVKQKKDELQFKRSSKVYRYRKSSKKGLESIRASMIVENKMNRKKSVFLLIFVFVLCTITLLWLLFK